MEVQDSETQVSLLQMGGPEEEHSIKVLQRANKGPSGVRIHKAGDKKRNRGT